MSHELFLNYNFGQPRPNVVYFQYSVHFHISMASTRIDPKILKKCSWFAWDLNPSCTRRRHRQTTELWRPNNVLWAVNGSFDASSKARKNIIPSWLFSESVVLSRLETSSLQWGTFPGMEAVISIFDHTLSSVKTSLIAAQATFSISLSLSQLLFAFLAFSNTFYVCLWHYFYLAISSSHIIPLSLSASLWINKNICHLLYRFNTLSLFLPNALSLTSFSHFTRKTQIWISINPTNCFFVPLLFEVHCRNAQNTVIFSYLYLLMF